MVYWAGMETGRDGEQRSRPVFKMNESKKRIRKKKKEKRLPPEQAAEGSLS